jgi:DNA-binding NarL/FixJ family response regulator
MEGQALLQRLAAGSWSTPRVTKMLLYRLPTGRQKRQLSVRELVLTTREAQILRMLRLGRSNRDISIQRSTAIPTVKNHVHSVLAKLGVRTRAEAAALPPGRGRTTWAANAPARPSRCSRWRLLEL